MSVYTDVDVEVSCDKCNDTIPEYRGKIYCGECAGIHKDEQVDSNHSPIAEAVKEWFDDNALILADSEYAFGQEIIESMRSGRMPKLGRR